MLMSITLFADKNPVGGIILQSYLFEDHPRPHHDVQPHDDNHDARNRPHYDDHPHDDDHPHHDDH